jgi:hypothetical protein
LDLNYPGNEMTVVIDERISRIEYLECLDVAIDQGDGIHFKVLVDFSEGNAE